MRPPRREPTLSVRSAARPASSPRSSIPADFATRLRLLPRILRTDLPHVEVVARHVRALIEPLDPAQVAQTLVERMSDLVPASWWVFLFDERDGRVVALASNEAPATARGWPARVAARVVDGGDVVVPRARTAFEGAPSTTVVGFGLQARGRLCGVLVGADRRRGGLPATLSPAARRSLDLVLEPASLALDTAARIVRAEHLAVTDDLTQLFNVRYLDAALRREVKRARRTGQPLAVLFMDLDAFKRVNDTWGHLAGSRTLVQFARIVRRATRESDIVARFGGDEFAVVLPETSAAGALILAERLRRRVAGHRFPAAANQRVRLTVSVGVAALSRRVTTAASLVRAADEAMYRVKHRGGNDVIAARAPRRRSRR